jgi:hypothetical protein
MTAYEHSRAAAAPCRRTVAELVVVVVVVVAGSARLVVASAFACLGAGANVRRLLQSASAYVLYPATRSLRFWRAAESDDRTTRTPQRDDPRVHEVDIRPND